MSDLRGLTVIILAGGKGTRLSSVVNDRPKVMALVNEEPFVTILLDTLLDSGLKNIVFSTGFKSNYIKKEIGNTYKGNSIFYSEEDTPLGTAGGLALAIDRYPSKHYLVLNGDNYIEYSFDLFHDFYFQKNCDALILVKKINNPARYGTVIFDKKKRVKSFREKDPSISSGFINCGVYMLNSSIVNILPREQPSSLEYDFFPKIIKSSFYAYQTKGKHIDIGTPESYNLAKSYFSKKTES